MRAWQVLSRKARSAVWPRGLGGRTILVLLVAVILVHLGTVSLYHHGESGHGGTGVPEALTGELAAAARAVTDSAPAGRNKRARALSRPGLDLRWSEQAQDLDIVTRQNDLSTLNGSIALPQAGTLTFAATAERADMPWAYGSTLLSTALMAAGVLIVAALLVRSLTRPLRMLATAADGIGRGPDLEVTESGPQEVRQVARAFNGMTRRIQHLLDDRTAALAAVSHDLRTPITRLRLRAGFLADPEMQAAFDADLEEMEVMIEATLAYLRGEAESEPRQMTDLAALLSTLADRMSDAGRAVTYVGPDHAIAALHASSIRRAFANLVDNAVAYGGNARIDLARTAGGLSVHVDDDGPGLPEAELERVFQPFQRLEASRNRKTGGVGLGLAIARRAFENEGGSARLVNRQGGGLRAEVDLPDAPKASPNASTGR